MRMALTLSAAMILVASTTACRPAPDRTPGGGAPEAAPPASPMPATTPPTAAPVPAADRRASWQGYGDITFGMNEAQARQAWRGELVTPGTRDDDPAACYFLTPENARTPAALGLMFEGGTFVRVGSDSADEPAPGGGRVGMARGEIERLYAGRIEEQPHKYVEGGRYLRIAQDGRALIFEIDAAGTVTEWRVGVPPQVDYVEGCG